MDNLNNNFVVDKKQAIGEWEWLKEYLTEALIDIPMTGDDFLELKEVLRSELQSMKLRNEYGRKCRAFEEILSPEQKEQFLELEYIGEKIDFTRPIIPKERI